MKKIIAMAMALVMMLAVAVPVFAADQTIVKTSTKDSSGEDAEHYVLEVPAEKVITWGAESTEISYKVEAHLREANELKVTVTGNPAMKYTGDSGKEYSIPYTLANAAYESNAPVVAELTEVKFNLNVIKDDWDKAVVGEYSDTLTFVAGIEKAN